MDLGKIGKFIQERRKLKKLTQVQLSEILGVSEKTIAKWEQGRGFPDTTLMLPLCKALDINANELLSGALLPTEKEYRENADKNLITMTKFYEQNAKRLLFTEWVILVLSISIILISCLFLKYEKIDIVWRIVILVFGFACAFFGLFFCLLIEAKVGFYECKHCHHNYIPGYLQVFLAMHMGRTRYMKCPNCGKRSWNKKVINSNSEEEINNND